MITLKLGDEIVNFKTWIFGMLFKVLVGGLTYELVKNLMTKCGMETLVCIAIAVWVAMNCTIIAEFR